MVYHDQLCLCYYLENMSLDVSADLAVLSHTIKPNHNPAIFNTTVYNTQKRFCEFSMCEE